MVKLLDCTLRDGGYYTNWDFSQETVDTYLESMERLPIDYIEVGYRSPEMREYYGAYFYLPEYLMKHLKQKSTKKLVIILNEKDMRAIDAEALLKPCIPYINVVRLAVDPNNFERALELAKVVKDLGFEVCFNLMYMSTWSDNPDLINQFGQLDGLVDTLYMVDSFGGVYPENIRDTLNLIKSKSNVKIGFHGHNNLELALINTLTAIECGVDIVDATITGMGRGAGNLKTELLLTVLNSKGVLELDYNALSKTVDDFSLLQKEYDWGTNLPYMVSGSNSLPQKNVMEWVSKRFYSFNSIIRALTNKSRGKEDNLNLMVFKPDQENIAYSSKALIVGGGSSVKEHQQAIENFLLANSEIIIIHASSKNAMAFKNVRNQQFYCLVGNEGYRLESIFNNAENVMGKCILPPYPRKMGTYIPEGLIEEASELDKVDVTDQFKDSHTALALQTATALGCEDVFMVGYDGYEGSIGQKEQELCAENEYMFKRYIAEHVPLKSLTSTKYKQLIPGSIFALV